MNMTTRILPTDKRGNVYYGPKTVAAAQDLIRAGADAANVVRDMRAAGYTNAAARVAKDNGVKEPME